MELSFEEKSAWGSLLAILVAAWLFFPVALTHTAAGGAIADLVSRLVFVVGVIIAIEIVYHSIIAARHGRQERDERDAEFDLKADRIAGYVLAFGVIWIVARWLGSAGSGSRCTLACQPSAASATTQ